MSLGSYQSEAGRGNLLNALAHPSVVNPAGAMASAAQAAGDVMRLRQLSSQQAAGEAFRNSIDPNTGMPNQTQFLKNLAADPRTSMDALAASGTGQTLDNNTYVTQMNRSSAVLGAAAGLIGQYPNGVPQNAINDEIDRIGPSAGWTPQQIVQAKGMFGDNPAANTQALIRSQIMHLDAVHALTATQPQFQTQNLPQGVQPTMTAPITSPTPGAMTNLPGGVRAGASPGQTQDYMFQPMDANGKPSGTPYKVTAPAGTVFPSMQGTQITPVPAPSGAPPGAPGSAFPPGYTGRGVPPPPNANLANPNKPAAPATAPSPAPVPIPGGQGLVRNPDGSVGTPGGGFQPSPTPAPSPAPAPVSQPPGGGVAVSVPMGTEEQLKADLGARNTDVAAIPQQQTQVQNMKHAYDALALVTTGKSQEAVNGMFNFLQGYGLLPPGATNRLENYDLFKKYTTKAIIDQGLIAGNTDLGRTLAGASNPSDLLSTAANREVLRNDIGKTIQGTAAAAAEKEPGNINTASGYLGRRADIARTTDPRGFAWSLYSPSEQAQILESVKGDKAASDRLHRAIGMGDALHLDVPFPTINRGAPAASATTGMAQPNPLIPPTNYAAATPNALAA